MIDHITATISQDENRAFRLWLSRQNTKRMQAGDKALNFSRALERAMEFTRTCGSLREDA
jgi:hypothetical protein